MDPISGLALACNILDLVGKAVKCGSGVAQIYTSTDGRKKDQSGALRSVDDLLGIVKALRRSQDHYKAITPDRDLDDATSRCVHICQTLQGLLDDCKAKPGSFFSASRAMYKISRHSSKIEELRGQLQGAWQALDSLVALKTQ
jgi:hypothetical protein